MHPDQPTPRLALIGGCGSSGTTLLAHLLSRHSSIVGAPELDVFNHPETWLPDVLAGAVEDLFARRRLTRGYKQVIGFCKAPPAWGIDARLVSAWARSSAGLEDFCAKLAAHVATCKRATWFVEKTPTNVYAFATFAERAASVPLMHQIRDGRDVAASLVRRGKTLFHAGSRWLYDTVAGLRARRSGTYLEIRYEDLVTTPRAALERVVEALGLAYEEALLAEGLEAAVAVGAHVEPWRERSAPRRWRSVPTDRISPQSVGCYQRELSRADVARLCRIRLTDRTADELAAPVRSFGELLEFLGYAGEPSDVQQEKVLGIREAWVEMRDYLQRAERSLRYTRTLPRVFTRHGTARGAATPQSR